MHNRRSIYDAIINDKKIICDGVLGRKFESSLFLSEERHLPPITRSYCEEYHPLDASSQPVSYVLEFEELSLKVRENADAYFKLRDKDKKDTFDPSGCLIKAKDINNVVAKIVADREFDRTREFKSLPLCLKIIGATIHGDIDLSNLNVDFSIRLIGCHIIGAVIMDRTQLKTLDLSGSVLERGMSASGIRIAGAFRARRTVSHSAVDLGGMQCEGIIDLSDTIFFPKCEPSRSTSHVAQRGILNMAFATVRTGVRLERARIYGGINLRQLSTGGILNLSDSLLRCSTAHIEMMATKLYTDDLDEDVDPELLSATEMTASAPSMIARFMHAKKYEDPNDPHLKTDIEREILYGTNSYDSMLDIPNSLQVRLIAEHQRGADTAIMLESAEIGGPIFARGARICGRVRMKRLHVKGGLMFQGARLRSPRSIRHGNGDLREKLRGLSEKTKAINNVLKLYGQFEKILSDPAGSDRKEFLIDLKGATVLGAIHFDKDLRENMVSTPDSDRVLFNDLKSAYPRAIYPCKINGGIEKMMRSVILGEVRLSNATIDGSVTFDGAIFYIPNDHSPPPTASKAILAMKNTVIDGSLNFRNTLGLQTIDGLNAEVKGDIKFYDNPVYSKVDEDYGRLSNFAQPVAKGPNSMGPSADGRLPEISFVGAKVSGRVNLLFEKNYYPSLKLSYATILGRLMIMPGSTSPLSNLKHEADDATLEGALKRLTSIIFLALFYNLKPTKNLQGFVAKQTKGPREWAKELHPVVDLRGMNVPVFVHHSKAWPKRDSLVVSGMRYQATEVLGHLYPKPLFWNDVHKNLMFNLGLIITPVSILKTFCKILITTALLILALGTLTLVGQSLVLDSPPILKPGWTISFLKKVGVINVCLSAVLLVIITSRLAVEKRLSPDISEKTSKAVRWLSLQRRHFGTRKVYKDIRPTDAYLQAAIVLRGAGRVTSANEVETARIKERMRGVSWRKNPTSKTLFWCFGLLIDYGYNPSRAITISLGLITFSAMIFHYYGVHLSPKDVGLSGEAFSAFPSRSFLYAADTFVPVLDLGLQKQWGPTDISSRIGQRLFLVIVLLKTAGWTAVTLIAMSVATRLETVWAKSRIV